MTKVSVGSFLANVFDFMLKFDAENRMRRISEGLDFLDMSSVTLMEDLRFPENNHTLYQRLCFNCAIDTTKDEIRFFWFVMPSIYQQTRHFLDDQ